MTDRNPMGPPSPEFLVTNARWAGAAPSMSVVTPFLRDDPTPLIEALGRNPRGAELIVLDDGTNDLKLTEKVTAAIEAFPGPARFISSSVNLGRSAGRNRLVSEARSGHILFLDADMLPDDDAFLQRYDDLVRTQNPAAVFGGFSDALAPEKQETALHRALARTSDCRPAAERNLAPGKTVCTSNLLVRRDVLEAVPFDEGFTGWGWEDVDWGIRTASKFDVMHIDNTATHLGLETPQQLLNKFARSGGNFQRLVTLHPKEIAEFPSYRAASAMTRVPGRKALRAVLAFFTRDPLHVTPMSVRLATLKLFRACSYADHLPRQMTVRPR